MTGSKRVVRLRRQTQKVSTAQAEIASKAVGYIRASSEERATSSFELATQEAAIRAFAESQGYELIAVVTDAGV